MSLLQGYRYKPVPSQSLKSARQFTLPESIEVELNLNQANESINIRYMLA
jgi:hypothetical protein